MYVSDFFGGTPATRLVVEPRRGEIVTFANDQLTYTRSPGTDRKYEVRGDEYTDPYVDLDAED
jgi:hypothetical protein